MNEDPAPPQNLVDLINTLAEPSEPPPVSMMPETVGWVVLALVLAVALLAGAIAGVKRHRANAYRRAALAELHKTGDDPVAVADVLRRTALAAYPRREVASLTGAAWIKFLRSKGRLREPRADAQDLACTPYTRSAPHAVPGLSAAAADWVRSHHRNRSGGAGR